MNITKYLEMSDNASSNTLSKMSECKKKSLEHLTHLRKNTKAN